MKKIQSFFVLKFSSSRLKNYKYNININFQEAQNNGELVRLGSSEIIRTLQRIKGQEFDQESLNFKLKEKRKLSKLPDSQENRLKLSILKSQIQDILFIPELISIVFDSKSHYLDIDKKGLYINGIQYKRFLASAANLRKQTVFYISSEYYDTMNYILNNDRNPETKVNASKNGAYWGLFNSSSIPVSWPSCVVIPDYEIKKVVKCHWVSGEEKNISVEDKDVELTQNCYDGQGLVEISQMEKWSDELGLDYKICHAIIRGPFLKGMVCSFPIQKFAQENNKEIIIDAWGNEKNVKDISVILSTSQFKMWQSYNSWEDYIKTCQKNKLSFGISRFSPKKDDNCVLTNYQYLQALNLDQKMIENISSETINYFNDLLGESSEKMLLFLLGKNIEKISESEDNSWWNEIDDNVTKALMLNDNVKNDPYIYQYFLKNISKKIKSSFLGQLLIFGNYQTQIVDPVAQCEFALGMKVEGKLKPKEYYSNYWNSKNVKKVVSCRSPLTAKGEVNIMPLVKDIDWYNQIYTGIIISHNGDDFLVQSSSDADGDLLMTTNCQEFINGAQEDLPISYPENKGEKYILTNDLVKKSDLASFGSQIGYITNLSSSLYCLQSNYEKGSREYNEIEMRITICRMLQGGAIDKAKSVSVPEMPKFYSNYQKLDYSLSVEELEQIKWENSLVLKKRPYFFKNLYTHYGLKFRQELENYDFISNLRYNISFDKLKLLENKTEEQEKLIQKYYDNSFFLHNSSIMNNVSSYLESQIKEIKIFNRNKNKQFNSSMYMSKDYAIDQEKLSKLRRIYKEYNSNKKAIRENNYDGKDKEMYSGLEEYIKYLQNRIAEEITSNEQELANLCVYLNYVELPNSSKEFCWKMGDSGIITNLIENTNNGFIRVPIQKENGAYKYLFNRYDFEEISLSDLEI